MPEKKETLSRQPRRSEAEYRQKYQSVSDLEFFDSLRLEPDSVLVEIGENGDPHHSRFDYHPSSDIFRANYLSEGEVLWLEINLRTGEAWGKHGAIDETGVTASIAGLEILKGLVRSGEPAEKIKDLSFQRSTKSKFGKQITVIKGPIAKLKIPDGYPEADEVITDIYQHAKTIGNLRDIKVGRPILILHGASVIVIRPREISHGKNRDLLILLGGVDPDINGHQAIKMFRPSESIKSLTNETYTSMEPENLARGMKIFHLDEEDYRYLSSFLTSDRDPLFDSSEQELQETVCRTALDSLAFERWLAFDEISAFDESGVSRSQYKDALLLLIERFGANVLAQAIIAKNTLHLTDLDTIHGHRPHADISAQGPDEMKIARQIFGEKIIKHKSMTMGINKIVNIVPPVGDPIFWVAVNELCASGNKKAESVRDRVLNALKEADAEVMSNLGDYFPEALEMILEATHYRK